MKAIGNFAMQSGKAILSDPCYNLNVQCLIRDLPTKIGNWIAFVEYSVEGSWGTRVSRIMAVHEDHQSDKLEIHDIEGEVGVDSGQAGIFDLKDFHGGEYDEWYDVICDKTLGKSQCGIVPGGFVSSSGFGDGGYRAAGAKVGDEYVMFEILFIPDVEEDEDHWDEEDADHWDDGDYVDGDQ